MGRLMVQSIPYIAKKDAICLVLLERARMGRTIYYSELGRLVGIPAQGPWKPILDLIGHEYEPDITYLVINKQFRVPGQIGFTPAKPPTEEQKRRAREVIKAVFAKYKVRDPQGGGGEP